ncbi:MAG: tRNA (mnm(5)s(2)U34)-methyltransferase [Halorhodospira sp.]
MSEPLTRRAQRHIRTALHYGSLAVDATAGNGHDTCFLAELVGATGYVLALDIQHTALIRTRQRLREASLIPQSVMVRADHARLACLTPRHWRGSVDAVMFNLGYHPGGDRPLITTPSSTRAALDAAHKLLRPGGVISVLAYRGHPGGAEEAWCVARWMGRAAKRGDGWQQQTAASARGPVLHLLQRQHSEDPDHLQEERLWRS